MTFLDGFDMNNQTTWITVVTLLTTVVVGVVVGIVRVIGDLTAAL